MSSNTESNQQLYEAVKSGDTERARDLLSSGADSNYRDIFDGTTPLHVSIAKQDIETARLLVENGADVNHCDNNVGSTPLGVASLMGNSSMVRMLIENNACLGDSEGDIIDEVRNLGLTEIVSMLEGACSR